MTTKLIGARFLQAAMPQVLTRLTKHEHPTGSNPILDSQIAKKSAAAAASGQAAFGVIGYAICSSCMLVTNKVAVHVLPAPSLLLFLQLFSAAAVVWLCGAMELIEVDALEWGKIKSFAPVSLAFLGVIYANIKTLQYANVETFIVFRASTPIIISLCDYAFLGRSLPEARSWLSLAGLMGGAVGYVVCDSGFEVREQALKGPCFLA